MKIVIEIISFFKRNVNSFIATLKQDPMYDQTLLDSETDFRMLMAGMSFFAPAMIDEVLIRWHVIYGFNGFDVLFNQALLWLLAK